MPDKNVSISLKDVPKLLKELKKNYEVVFPQKKGDDFIFSTGKSSDIRLGYQTTILPPKEYLMPSGEEFFIYDKGELRTPEIPKKQLCFFGLNMKDLKALLDLDQIMKGPYPDFYYLRRRENSVLVAFADGFDNDCAGGDLILNREKNNLVVVYESEKGKKITKSKYFKKIKKGPSQPPKEDMTDLDKILQDPELLSKAVRWSKGKKIWEELAEICLGCGICTYVCPICHCFSIDDEIKLSGACIRCRKWEACTLPDFAAIAGGFNFRGELKDRYYNWYYHKFVRAYKEYKKPQCVACGRCQKYCPAGINIEEVLKRIIKEYKESKK